MAKHKANHNRHNKLSIPFIIFISENKNSYLDGIFTAILIFTLKI